MKTEFFKHKVAYLVLIAVLAFYVFLFFAFWPNIIYQRYLGIFIAAFYFFWGVISHSSHKAISKKVILEYLTVSFLGGLILFLLTL